MTIELRPSKSHVWTKCAAAPLYASRSPERLDGDDDPAREGTCAAWVAEQVLKGIAPDTHAMVGKTHPNGWLVTDDMAQHVQGYVSMVLSRGGVTSAEQYVKLFDDPLIAGTLDCSTSVGSDGILHVTDLKYGFRIVEVFENPQVIIYSAAELRRLADPNITQVSLEIYQPRAFHPDGIHRKWLLSVAELNELADWVIQCGLACSQPDPVATPGAQCRDCDAITSCKAVTDTLGSAYEVVRAVGQRRMTGEELGKQWLFTELATSLLKSHKSALDAEIEHRIKSGEHVPGVTMAQRFGNRKFTVPDMMVHALTGIDPYKKVLMSPAELEKAGANVKVVEHIAKAPSIGFKLTPFTPKDIGKAFMNKG